VKDVGLEDLNERIGSLVDEWHFTSFHGTAAARDTDVWNLIHGAKEELKRRLIDLVLGAVSDEAKDR
jgi:hypothetical protein